MSRSRTANQVLITTASVSLVVSLVWVGVSAYGLMRRSQALRGEMEGAITWGKLNRIKQLLDQGANPRCRGAAGKTIAMAAADRGDLPLLERTLQFRDEVNRADALGATVLHHAVHRGAKIRLIRRILEAGANPNCMTNDGYTPLHYAVIEGHEDAVRTLLDAGANVNAQQAGGDTPLAVAMWAYRLHLVQYLLSRGADPQQRCHGRTPLAIAKERRERLAHALRRRVIDLDRYYISDIVRILEAQSHRRAHVAP